MGGEDQHGLISRLEFIHHLKTIESHSAQQFFLRHGDQFQHLHCVIAEVSIEFLLYAMQGLRVLFRKGVFQIFSDEWSSVTDDIVADEEQEIGDEVEGRQ